MDRSEGITCHLLTPSRHPSLAWKHDNSSMLHCTFIIHALPLV
jgi:hypothetical protein